MGREIVMDDNKPCLFDYATSELSQDAFFAWLLAWTDKKYTGPEHDLAISFLKTVFKRDRQGLSLPSDISIRVWRQYHHIDVFCAINDGEFAVIFEDKVNAQQHDNQLEHYLENILGEKRYKHVVGIYCKTGDQSDYSAIEDLGYVVMNRLALIKLFDTAEGVAACNTNKIIADFACHLRGIDKLTNGYRTDAVKTWDENWNAWKGFYMALQDNLRGGSWDYVPNPAGGFMGFWRHWHEVQGGHVYLQLEMGKACFKVEVGDNADAQTLKVDWNERFVKACDAMSGLSIKVIRPPVLRVGTWMTVAILDADYRVVDAEGKLNFPATTLKLREMEKVLDKALDDLNSSNSEM